MLNIEAVDFRFYICEFICSFLAGYINYAATVSSRYYDIDFFYLCASLSLLSITVLIIAFESVCLAHFNPSVTIADFIVRYFLYGHVHLYEFFFIITAQFAGFIVAASIVRAFYNDSFDEIIELKETRFFNTFGNSVILFGFIISFTSVLIGLKARRKSIVAPLIIGFYAVSVGIYSDTASMRTFNPASAVGSAIIYGSHSPWEVMILIFFEFLAGVSAAFFYLLLFKGYEETNADEEACLNYVYGEQRKN
ncbi:Aquaporin PIP2-1 [Cucumispora dikerogammari]|nr:Aquaporin PIP2-1 [Cucumispora dikerogammari]